MAQIRPTGLQKRTVTSKYVTLAFALILGTFFLRRGLRQSVPNSSDRDSKAPSITDRLGEKYDLPTLLNIPSFVVKGWEDDGSQINELANRVAAAHPGSILALYRAIPGNCAREPYLPRLRSAVQSFGSAKGRVPNRNEALARKNNTLVMHIQSSTAHKSNTSLKESFIKEAVARAKEFSNAIVIASFGDSGKKDQANADAVALAKLLRGDDKNVVIHGSNGQDEDLYLMHVAKHLLVHRDSFSALGALVCSGTVYYTPEFSDYMGQNQFKWIVTNARPALDVKLFKHRASLSGMGPVAPSCCKFRPFGIGDGEKIICSNSRAFSQQSCWVLSVGCAGKWSFEEGIVANTPCKVHTFDCSGTWDIPVAIADRVTLHRICLGQENDPRENFMGWNKMIELGSSQSGLGPRKMPALAKMDIEGHEFPVLKALVDFGKEEMLPDQIALEVHSTTGRHVGPPYYKKSPEQGNFMVNETIISSLFRNLSSRGYQLVHRADNPFCGHCSEVTLVRKIGLPPIF